MSVDCRVVRVLGALGKFNREMLATKILSPSDCNPHVVGSLLSQAKKHGLAEFRLDKSSRWWFVTDAGREFLAQPHLGNGQNRK